MQPGPGILARGPWTRDDVEVEWRREPFVAEPGAVRAADAALAELRGRGSPSHDGLAARLRDFRVAGGRLHLECEPARWALRLLPDHPTQALSATCVVRASDGRWLAGRRADWLATWAGRWALGAAGSVEVDENPADTLVRELEEEWAVSPARLRIEALIRLPSSMAMLLGQAWLHPDADVVPNDEHDEFAWWPADPAQWPEHADAPLRRTAALLAE